MNRQLTLIKLISERFDGNQAAFARAIGVASSQVNQWVNGYRNLGDAGAHRIELKLGLAQGYFDMPVAQRQRDLSRSTTLISEKIELRPDVLETIELIGKLQENPNSEILFKSLNHLIRAITNPSKFNFAVETKDFAGKPPKTTEASGKTKNAKKSVSNKVGD
ncbi:hypothetical protein [uncultured Limnobacter sp.]|uniref:hypothetical protein n=1 Tax=uncultured Limnobacter sp. TaxID=199681 RepID=UPI0030F75361